MTQESIQLIRINNDINGNPRYVIHFLDLLSLETQTQMHKDHNTKEYLTNEYSCFTDVLYKEAHKRAKKLGGTKYRGKNIGGGFVFSTYNTKTLIADIKAQA